ncbi:MAG TPA: hypothetical protein H9867_08055 [Candidatus Corynebacterium gallistercoris]|uniref:Uncharacterized protein n=1 Tax=Candidatus Corynebacterium gallistercoris TaxID=2838530 RepID=A0A9D1S009_9CORY|nr:hypothetical protein [Candidatus Corynebacterium gallistercoris]
MSLSPELHVEKNYKEGYVPSSLDSQHSSLHRTSTWVGMGLWLALMPFLGMLVFGLATHLSGVQEAGMSFLIGGIVGSIVVVGLAIGLIHAGRKNYREYKARSGRIM